MYGPDGTPHLMSQFVATTPDPPTNVFFKALDFFEYDIPEGGFQVAYDYTFLCALPLELREPWGRRYAELISPGGESLRAGISDDTG